MLLRVSTMALFGIMGEFKTKKEPWSAYMERLAQFLEANDVAKGKKVAMLLIGMGATTYGLLRNLVQPNKPKDKMYDERVTVLKGTF